MWFLVTEAGRLTLNSVSPKETPPSKLKLNVGSKSKAVSSVVYTGKDEKIRTRILTKLTKGDITSKI